MKLDVRKEAEADVVESSLWYSEAEMGLGEEFINSVPEAYGRVEMGPQHC